MMVATRAQHSRFAGFLPSHDSVRSFGELLGLMKSRRPVSLQPTQPQQSNYRWTWQLGHLSETATAMRRVKTWGPCAGESLRRARAQKACARALEEAWSSAGMAASPCLLRQLR
jgi:hypothetical protein